MKYCTSRKSTNYKTLVGAKLACFLDKECSTIVDYKCDDRHFYLCKKDSVVKSSKSSCIYARQTTAGIIFINVIYNAIYVFQILIPYMNFNLIYSFYFFSIQILGIVQKYSSKRKPREQTLSNSKRINGKFSSIESFNS